MDPVKMTFTEWLAEGTRRFGADRMAWRFVCPVCKTEQGLADFKATTPLSDEDIRGAIAFSCIGRFNGSTRKAFKESEGSGVGCSYAGHRANFGRRPKPNGAWVSER